MLLVSVGEWAALSYATYLINYLLAKEMEEFWVLTVS